MAGSSRPLCEDLSYVKFWGGVGRQAAPALVIRTAATCRTGHKSASGAALTAPPLETVMTKIPELHPMLRAWLLEGPLFAQVPAYVARLQRGRYAAHTCARCLNAVAHFAHWMSMCHLPARMLDEGCIDQFLRYHLPRCVCLGGALRTPNEVHAALVPMLEILRAEGVIARPTAPAGPIADELRSYDAHMRDARGLTGATRTRSASHRRTAAGVEVRWSSCRRRRASNRRHTTVHRRPARCPGHHQ